MSERAIHIGNWTGPTGFLAAALTTTSAPVTAIAASGATWRQSSPDAAREEGAGPGRWRRWHPRAAGLVDPPPARLVRGVLPAGRRGLDPGQAGDHSGRSVGAGLRRRRPLPPPHHLRASPGSGGDERDRRVGRSQARVRAGRLRPRRAHWAAVRARWPGRHRVGGLVGLQRRQAAQPELRGTPVAAAAPDGRTGEYTLHDLRHFYASGLIAAGCDVVTVQRALG